MIWLWNFCSKKGVRESANLMLALVLKDSLHSSLQISNNMMIWLVKLNQAMKNRISIQQLSSWKTALLISQKRKSLNRVTNGIAQTVENIS